MHDSPDESAPSQPSSPRRPWIAALGNLVLPPIGHLHAGAPLRGILAAGLGGLVWAAGTLFAVRQSSFAALVLLWLATFGFFIVWLPRDAYRIARRHGEGYVARRCHRWPVYLATIAALMILAGVFRVGVMQRIYHPYRLPSASMSPTLQPGDHVIADASAYWTEDPRRNDVIVFHYRDDPTKVMVARVIGLPGETIELRHRAVWIDGEPFDDSHSDTAEDKERDDRDNTPPVQLAADDYFVMGDNREHSYDSRFRGPVSRADIAGRVHVVYFSRSPEPAEIHWERIGTMVH